MSIHITENDMDLVVGSAGNQYVAVPLERVEELIEEAVAATKEAVALAVQDSRSVYGGCPIGEGKLMQNLKQMGIGQ